MAERAGPPELVDVLVVGAGITGIYQLYRALEAGFDAQLLEAGRRRGRHLVLEPLPRRPVRLRELHLRLPVLPGAVGGVGVAGALRRAAGDRALPEPRRRPLRSAPPHAFRPKGAGRRSYDEASATWTVTTTGGEQWRTRFLISATGVLSVPFFPDVPGRERLRRRAAPHRALAGCRRRLRGQAGRDRRHRLQRCAAHPDRGRAGRLADRLPAHRQLVHAAEQRAHHRRGAGAATGRVRIHPRDAEHLAGRFPAPAARPRHVRRLIRRSAARSTRRCGAAAVSASSPAITRICSSTRRPTRSGASSSPRRSAASCATLTPPTS